MRSKNLLAAGAGVAAAGLAYTFAVRPWHLHWGATPKEESEHLPGDEFIEVPQSTTHAVTILAPADRVWPWVAQIGQRKGGFYSYTFLENLVGCEMRNANRIEPSWQNVKVGDLVYLHPNAPWPIIHLHAGRALVIGDPAKKMFSWGFYLKPIDGTSCRLIVRSRGGKLPMGALSVPFHYGVMEPVHFIMERKMMLTIKHLAERAARILQ